MQYHIARNGQNYGPYTLDDLQRYLASGNVLGTDLAKSDEMPDWLPVSQVLAGSAQPGTLSGGQPGAMTAFAGGAPVAYAPLATSSVAADSPYPAPPNLHWVLVLVIGIFCSVFLFVWMFVQALWMRQIEPKSQAFLYYSGAIGSLIFGFVLSSVAHSSGLAVLFFLAYLVLVWVGHFNLRASLEQHYNTAEPIGLKLSAVMTFFFNTIYFQYHFNRINEARQAARYTAPRSL